MITLGSSGLAAGAKIVITMPAARLTAQPYASAVLGGKLTEAQLSTLLADLDGDGVGETPLSTDGTVEGINEEAYAKWFEDNRSMLVKDVKMYVGGVN